MTATAALIALLFVSASQAQGQTVSIIDILVEGQTLYTLAVDKQPESLTGALDLARQAERAIAADTLRKRLPADTRPDAQDLAVLGTLRARTAILVSGIEQRRNYFVHEFEDIQKLVERKKTDAARLALDHLPADAPTADPACPFADLRAELDRDPARTPTKASRVSSAGSKWIATGALVAAVSGISAVAAHYSMNGALDDLNFLPPGSSEWWGASDHAEQMRKVRNGFTVTAVSAGAALAIYGAARAAHNKAVRGSVAPLRPRTVVGFNFDFRNPAITVVRIF